MRRELAQHPARPSRPERSLRLVSAGVLAPRKEWIERSALIERLMGAEAKIILVEAPAGYGKTTVIAQWRGRAVRARRFAWISLDERDDEPRKLCWHITSALLRVCPELDGERILRHLRVKAPGITGEVLPLLANGLAALAVPVVIVLDDYHRIGQPGCHEQVTFLLQHLPASVQVVLATRTDPPLPLARWRAAGEMAEFRTHELRFTAAEAAPVVSAASGVTLSESALRMLIERTEGWPAGLYLAALSLRGQHAPAALVREFTGASGLVADFLTEQVLSRQAATTRRFLLQTSILGRFCASLCDAVTGSADAAEILASLERENAFIVPLDQSRHWFRYHHLLAGLLRGQLDRTEPGAVPALHRRASAWYRRAGMADEAIDHAIAADDRRAAVHLIAGHWYPQAADGGSATVRRWVRGLGDRAITGDPVAAHCAAWSAAMSGDRDSVRRWLPVMTASTCDRPLPDGMRSPESSAALLQGLYGFDGLDAMRSSAERAAELETDPSQPWYALARAALGFSRYLSGDQSGAKRPLLQAVASDALTPDVRVLSSSALSLALAELGELAGAERAAGEAMSLMASSNPGPMPLASLAYAAAGATHARLGRLQEARKELGYALYLRRWVPGHSVWATIDIMLLLIPVLADLGDRAPATALAGEAGRALAAAGHPNAMQARLECLQRRLAGRPRDPGLADPLTERELTVLHLLRSAYPLREIAAGQDLSVNTIKTQVRSIYRKLGVSARGDAIARGHQAGLL